METNGEGDMDTPAKCVQLLLAVVLDFAREGGLTNDEAAEIFGRFTECMISIDDFQQSASICTAFVAECWAPAAQRVLAEPGSHDLLRGRAPRGRSTGRRRRSSRSKVR